MLNNDKIKIVDFIIFDNIYIEITGYAYTGWQDDFKIKIKCLKDSLPKESFILLLTYDNKEELLFNDMVDIKLGKNIFIKNINNENEILKTINFILGIQKLNKELEKCIL